MTSTTQISLLLLLIFAVCGQATSLPSTPSSWNGVRGTRKKIIVLARSLNTSSKLSSIKLLPSRPPIEGPLHFEEATISDIQAAFNDGKLTSFQLVEHYLEKINALNPYLNAVVEVNPDALEDAAKADLQRSFDSHLSPLHGIPVLVKDNINTRDKLNTTSGSFALLGSVVPCDAGVIHRLRNAGAIILGKASMSEWDNLRSTTVPQGWSPRGGQGRNPYPTAISPCGTSTGSAIAVAANLVTVSLGTDLNGAITCPAVMNSVVGIKPTVGITSRSGMIPISPRLQTIGPMARTMEDAVKLLDVITGFDPLDAKATKAAKRFIPNGGFQKSLKKDGLKGKKVGILRSFFDEYSKGSLEANTFTTHFRTMRLKGAILVDNLKMKNIEIMVNPFANGEAIALLAEFKLSLNAYLKDLVYSPVRSLADVIAFNNQHPIEERIDEYGQTTFLASQKTNGIGVEAKKAMKRMARLSKEGVTDLMKEKNLDAVVFPEYYGLHAFGIGGFPIVSIPAGYNSSGAPFGISFAGLRGSDSTLIEIAYAFEQATQVRKPPPKIV